MEYIEVFRVEKKTFLYDFSNSIQCVLYDGYRSLHSWENLNRFPSPRLDRAKESNDAQVGDTNIGIFASEVCGTESVESLLYWFPRKVLRNIKKHKDYRVLKLRVPREHCRIGERQVVFKRKEAIVVKEAFV